MSLALTPERLAATYMCLRAFPPFNRIGLPTADYVEFRVSKDATEHGHYKRKEPPRHDEHHISISARNVGHFSSLAWVLGHEMLHLSQALRRTETPNTQHNAEFHQLAKRACKQFGWDAKVFA